MALAIHQTFPLGRYHATRWNQNAFEDRHGEWPPSPWRLVRALVVRWFQYSRETGSEDYALRDALLRCLASEVPSFVLPDFTWRGNPAPRQYHKCDVAWTDAKATSAAVKKAKTTLTVDHFRSVSPNAAITWCWPSLELSEPQQNLLSALLSRMLYFGRTESWTKFKILESMPVDQNCLLSETNQTGSPVLVPDPKQPLVIERLLASTDDAAFQGKQIPPGTKWYYATLPKVPAVKGRVMSEQQRASDIRCMQFAVGGRVYPDVSQWIRLTERFRGTVLKHATQFVTEGAVQSFGDLWQSDDQRFVEWRGSLKLLSGKDGEGRPLKDHQHAFFGIWPDDHGQPTRLVVWRLTAFQPFEIDALLKASHSELAWRFSRQPRSRREAEGDEWRLRLVPLPNQIAAADGMIDSTIESKCWDSLTPFVTPDRRRFRSGGRLRAGETATKLLEYGINEWLRIRGNDASVVRIEVLHDNSASDAPETSDPTPVAWVITHETAQQRANRLEQRQRRVRPGFRYRITLSKPVSGPVICGHSSHFGLGVFVPAIAIPVVR